MQWQAIQSPAWISLASMGGADRAGLDFAIETSLEHGDMFPVAGEGRGRENR
jgi:hypothetical protein